MIKKVIFSMAIIVAAMTSAQAVIISSPPAGVKIGPEKGVTEVEIPAYRSYSYYKGRMTQVSRGPSKACYDNTGKRVPCVGQTTPGAAPDAAKPASADAQPVANKTPVAPTPPPAKQYAPQPSGQHSQYEDDNSR